MQEEGRSSRPSGVQLALSGAKEHVVKKMASAADQLQQRFVKHVERVSDG